MGTGSRNSYLKHCNDWYPKWVGRNFATIGTQNGWAETLQRLVPKMGEKKLCRTSSIEGTNCCNFAAQHFGVPIVAKFLPTHFWYHSLQKI